MWLQLGGVYSTGNELLDRGISDSVIVTTAQGVYLVTTTGKYGGLTVYRINPDGSLTQTDSLEFPDNLQFRITDMVSVAEVNGQTMIFFGASSTLTGVALRDDGTLGPIRYVPFEDLENAHQAGAEGALLSLTRLSDRELDSLPAHDWQTATVAVYEITVEGQTFLLTLGALDEQVTSYRQTSGGNWRQVDALGTAHGLGISAPSAMEIVTLQGQTYLLVASSGSSSISVIAVQPGGALEPVQHIIDTGSTRFANVQDLAVVQVGDHVFVFAVGADHGISMFQMLPDGTLVHMESWGDDGSGALDTPLTISAVAVEGTIHVVVGAQNAEGITHFTVDISALGQVVTGSTTSAERVTGGSGRDVLIAGSDNDTLVGGGSHDVLVSGPGRTTMTGGAGADTFVIRAASTHVTITDFRVGEDRLDLTDLPMLRSLDQLTITTTATGAIITYRGTTIVVQSQNGQPLTAQDLFQNGLVGPDSLIIILDDLPPGTEPPEEPGYPEGPAPTPPAPPAPPVRADVPGRWVIGTEGRDTLTGGSGNDYIFGGAGHDLIRGGAGHDTLFGGFGHDTIYGGDGNDLIVGGPGNDRLWGEAGNDTIFGISGNNRFGGGAGDDLLVGGTGNDTIYGGEGNDTIYGNAGNNSLWGMRGDDLIHGGDGNDRIGGGRGNDTIYGHGGNDTIFGGMGDDLIYGGAGNDVIWGMDDNDTIFGGTGNDFIHGGRGDDVLDGGPGNDTMRGGPGADTFIFREGHERLLIEDFTFSDNDRLLLDESLWGGGLTAEDVVETYGTVVGNSIVLDFGSGDVITLAGLTDLDQLAGYIDFF
ncbi:MAG: hypothetical protein ACK4NW_05385 [Roseinatronobacter sp.]